MFRLDTWHLARVQAVVRNPAALARNWHYTVGAPVPRGARSQSTDDVFGLSLSTDGQLRSCARDALLLDHLYRLEPVLLFRFGPRSQKWLRAQFFESWFQWDPTLMPADLLPLARIPSRRIPKDGQPRESYTVRQDPNTGDLSCECPGFTNSKRTPASCRHTLLFAALLSDVPIRPGEMLRIPEPTAPLSALVPNSQWRGLWGGRARIITIVSVTDTRVTFTGPNLGPLTVYRENFEDIFRPLNSAPTPLELEFPLNSRRYLRRPGAEPCAALVVGVTLSESDPGVYLEIPALTTTVVTFLRPDELRQTPEITPAQLPLLTLYPLGSLWQFPRDLDPRVLYTVVDYDFSATEIVIAAPDGTRLSWSPAVLRDRAIRATEPAPEPAPAAALPDETSARQRASMVLYPRGVYRYTRGSTLQALQGLTVGEELSIVRYYRNGDIRLRVNGTRTYVRVTRRMMNRFTRLTEATTAPPAVTAAPPAPEPEPALAVSGGVRIRAITFEDD